MTHPHRTRELIQSCLSMTTARISRKNSSGHSGKTWKERAGGRGREEDLSPHTKKTEFLIGERLDTRSDFMSQFFDRNWRSDRVSGLCASFGIQYAVVGSFSSEAGST